jgi:uncharacterized cupredoxin-like copper-binding protein
MKKMLFALCLVTAFPLVANAAGSHGDAHHHAPATEGQKNAGDHGHMQDQSGHASTVGGPADIKAVTRVIHVELLDTMRFVFDVPLALKRGDVVRFVVTNRGQIRHEFSIGNEAEQDSHRAMMRNMPNMVHEDPNSITVDPADTKELVWRFDGTDLVVIACNIPGHAEAGMVAKVKLES